jgi:hypothetical protein
MSDVLMHPRAPDPLAGEATIDPRAFLNRVFPVAMEALDKIMAFTPVDRRRHSRPLVDAPHFVRLLGSMELVA